jgi:hypothetical protein
MAPFIVVAGLAGFARSKTQNLPSPRTIPQRSTARTPAPVPDSNGAQQSGEAGRCGSGAHASAPSRSCRPDIGWAVEHFRWRSIKGSAVPLDCLRQHRILPAKALLSVAFWNSVVRNASAIGVSIAQHTLPARGQRKAVLAQLVGGPHAHVDEMIAGAGQRSRRLRGLNVCADGRSPGKVYGRFEASGAQ